MQFSAHFCAYSNVLSSNYTMHGCQAQFRRQVSCLIVKVAGCYLQDSRTPIASIGCEIWSGYSLLSDYRKSGEGRELLQRGPGGAPAENEFADLSTVAQDIVSASIKDDTPVNKLKVCIKRRTTMSVLVVFFLFLVSC